VVAQVMADMSKTNDKKIQLDVSSLYAKVNKQDKGKTDVSSAHDQTVKDTPILPPKIEPYSAGLQESTYEEIGQSRPTGQVTQGADGSVKSKKTRRSVKDRINMFERKDSSSGEEPSNTSPPIIEDGDYAKLKSPPIVSPKPSPSSRRRPKANEYEEICLPFLARGESQQSVHSNPSIQTATSNCKDNDNVCNSSLPASDPDSKQETCTGTLNEHSVNSSHTDHSGHAKRPAPPVPQRRSRGRECHHDDFNELGITGHLTPQHSDHEPQVGTPRLNKTGHLDHTAITPSDIRVNPRHTIHEEDVEGDYCAISKIQRPDDKHVTVVNVDNSDEQSGRRKQSTPGLSGNAENKTVIKVFSSSKKLSQSQSDINSIASDITNSPKLSRSHENINVDEGDYASLDFSVVKPIQSKSASEENMKKLFAKKASADISGPKPTDLQDDVVGNNYKSLSRSGSDNVNDLAMAQTVEVNIEELGITDKDIENALAEGEGSDHDSQHSYDQVPSEPEPETEEDERKRRQSNRHRKVPDYEKWNLHSLLTQANISIVDKDYTDTGSEDEIVYDNVPEKLDPASGQSDDSGVCESNSQSEESLKPPEPCGNAVMASSSGDEASLRDTRHGLATSTTSTDSRLSTACEYLHLR